MKSNILIVGILGSMTGVSLFSQAQARGRDEVLLYPYYTVEEKSAPDQEVTFVLDCAPEIPLYEVRPPDDAAVDNGFEHGKGRKRPNGRLKRDVHNHKPRKAFSPKGNNRRRLMQQFGHL